MDKDRNTFFWNFKTQYHIQFVGKNSLIGFLPPVFQVMFAKKLLYKFIFL